MQFKIDVLQFNIIYLYCCSIFNILLMVLAIITVENSSCCLIFLSKQWYMSLWYSLTNKKLQCLKSDSWDSWQCLKSSQFKLYFIQVCGLIIVGNEAQNYSIIRKFDTVVLGLISNNDETAYLDEVERLTSWCQDNCLSLNVSKTKELIVDFRKRQQRPYTPLMISGTPVERVSSFKYLGVNISEDLTWTTHIQTQVKKARQRLYHLRQLRKFRVSPAILKTFLFRGHRKCTDSVHLSVVW